MTRASKGDTFFTGNATRDSLLELEGLFPVIHAKIIANLNLYLATRLMATTEIARRR